MVKWFEKSQFGVYFLTHENEKGHIKFEEYGDLPSLAKRIMYHGLTIPTNSKNVPAQFNLYGGIYIPPSRILMIVKY